jgi:hypothetical protein
MMSISDRRGDCFYTVDDQPMVTACHGDDWPAMPPCAYCATESTRTCDAPADRPRGSHWGRCGRRMCEAHSIRVGEHHDLCREHPGGDRLATLRAGDTAERVHWEIIETKAVPIRRAGTDLDHRSRAPVDGPGE